MKSTDEVRISPSGTLSDGTKRKQLQQQHTHYPVDVKTVTKSADISMIQAENNDVDEEIKAIKEEMKNLKREESRIQRSLKKT